MKSRETFSLSNRIMHKLEMRMKALGQSNKSRFLEKILESFLFDDAEMLKIAEDIKKQKLLAFQIANEHYLELTEKIKEKIADNSFSEEPEQKEKIGQVW